MIDFGGDSRGIWWDRLLLNLDSHLKEKSECLKYIKLAMKDSSILEKELLLIQDRAIKIDKEKEIELRIILDEPVKKCIKNRVLGKDLGDGRVNRFVIRNDENDEVECSVEEVARKYYLENEGFTNGVHDEGAIWHTIFGILFYDIIFDVEEFSDTWISECQDSPIDLPNTLYSRRKTQFDSRFEWLNQAEDQEIENLIRNVWKNNCQITNRECNWSLFESPDIIIDFWSCLPRDGIYQIFKRLAENYRNCRSGFPDLTMWNISEKRVTVVEVKGPGDKLSTKQRLWLDCFQKFGIRAEVCHVAAENDKQLL
ncbi:unnamed protein product [Caenorhabditis angaria]|uniref:Fanconi-associated nuclease n=1 Tax=Caenorhabditis angaria TaxID=860376 RepID=A0A9P1N5W4_9PELO|nr:unnamed protein product [Caenorhabditis angaria]